MSAACPLCGGPTATLFRQRLLGHHEVELVQCPACGLARIESPTWLDEAYAHALADIDTGALARNRVAVRVTATFLALAGVTDEPCLDWGAGHGVFVRMMRDAGFRFHASDPHAANLFARGFEWSDTLGRPAAVTAFEVLEHLVDPVRGFGEIAAFGAPWIVTSTELIPGARPTADWRYLAPESGQHVAFYRADTLARLGRAAGYPIVLAGPRYQLFAREPTAAWKWRAAVRWGALLHPLLRRRRASLTESDSDLLKARGR